MTQERQKVLDKIAKLKRLATSSEPHEAAAAFRQMQKMMEIHQITEAEMTGIEVKSAEARFKERRGKTVPIHYKIMVGMITYSLGVEAVYDDREQRKDGGILKHDRLSVRYFGLPGRPEMAVYAHELMLKSMHKAWKQKLEEDQAFAALNSAGLYGKNARQAFYLGWLSQVEEQLTAYGFQEGEKKAIRAGRDLYYGTLGPVLTRNTRISSAANEAGAEAAKDFQLHRGMDESHKRLSHG